MTIELTSESQERLEKLAAESNVTPSALAQRAVEDYLAYREQLTSEVNEAESEAERDGWIPHDEVFEELFSRLRKTA